MNKTKVALRLLIIILASSCNYYSIQYLESMSEYNKRSFVVDVHNCTGDSILTICYGFEKGTDLAILHVTRHLNFDKEFGVFYIGRIEQSLDYNVGSIHKSGKKAFAISFEEQDEAYADSNSNIISLWYFNEDLFQLIKLDAQLYSRINQGYELH